MNVANLRHKAVRNITTDIYCGRPSILGNRFSHIDAKDTFKVASRAEAISRYEEWLRALPEDSPQKKMICSFKGNETLFCWCAPLPCHCDIIIKLWKEYQETK